MYKYYNLLFLNLYVNNKNKIQNLKNWNILVFNGKKINWDFESSGERT